MKVFQFILAALASGVAAVPATKEARAPVQQIAGFDDIAIAPIGSPFSRPPIPYKGLNYTGFAIQGGILGVPTGGGPAAQYPHSLPNSAFFSVLSQVTAGGTPTIYRAGGLFNLQSLWVGCTLNVGVTVIPYRCQIIAAVVQSDTLTSLATFTIPASPNMTQVVFPAPFRRVSKVTIILAGDFADYVLTANVDDVRYQLL